MNPRIRAVLAGVACVAACAIGRADQPAAGAAPEGAQVVVDNPVMGPPPSPGHVWMPGRWNSEGGQWKWVAGHWELPPSRSAVWVAGHWVPQNGQWAWVNGAWNASEAAQSPSAPPQPPGQLAAQGEAPGQSVPMPGSPAPYVEGPYVQGAQQPAVVYQTYPAYGPADYSLGYYPGYYWAVDPWAWALYPSLYYGLGWGYGGYGYSGHGGYYGRGGHGGYGHGGHSGGVRAGTGGFSGHYGRGH